MSKRPRDGDEDNDPDAKRTRREATDDRVWITGLCELDQHYILNPLARRFKFDRIWPLRLVNKSLAGYLDVVYHPFRRWPDDAPISNSLHDRLVFLKYYCRHRCPKVPPVNMRSHPDTWWDSGIQASDDYRPPKLAIESKSEDLRRSIKRAISLRWDGTALKPTIRIEEVRFKEHDGNVSGVWLRATIATFRFHAKLAVPAGCKFVTASWLFGVCREIGRAHV